MATDELDVVLSVAREVIRRPVGPSDNFFALGGSSMAAVEFSLRLEEELGRDVDLLLLFTAETFTDYSRALGEAV